MSAKGSIENYRQMYFNNEVGLIDGMVTRIKLLIYTNQFDDFFRISLLIFPISMAN